jgi:hypothetical protein
MNLHRNGWAPKLPDVGKHYENPRQLIAEQSEWYVGQYVPCLYCGGTLHRDARNRRERDCTCSCGQHYQVKSRRIRRSEVLAGADHLTTLLPLVLARNSSLILLVRDGLSVVDLWAAPRHLIPLQAIRPRPRRLAEGTQRAGEWHCYVDCRQIDHSSRVHIIADGRWGDWADVRAAWQQLLSLPPAYHSEWVTNVAGLIAAAYRRGESFRIEDLYRYESLLAAKCHSSDANSVGVRGRIRSAVQTLCGLTILEQPAPNYYQLLATRQQAMKAANLTREGVRTHAWC